jgi:hypothetical protein
VKVYELIWQTDEPYYTVAFFDGELIANQIAKIGNDYLGEPASRYDPRFEVREHEVLDDTNIFWTRQDFIDILNDKAGEVDDYFPLPVEEDGWEGMADVSESEKRILDGNR